MIHFKPLKEGISLTESIIALAIVAIMTTTLFTTLGKIWRTSVSGANEQLVISALYDKFVELDLQNAPFDEFDEKSSGNGPKKFDLPEYCPRGTIEYYVSAPSKKSALASCKNIKIERLIAHWPENGRMITAQLLRLRYYPKGSNASTKRV